ncbi:MAG: ribosome small subunit-dependent GTPase A [Acidimicrobiia bacterium]
MASPANPQGIVSLGWFGDWEQRRAAHEASGDPARVVRHDGVKVLVSDGVSLRHATFSRSLSLAVGDWVLIENETVTGALERSSELVRESTEGGPQVIAANVDLVLVVFGVDRPLRRAKVLRFAAFAWDIGAKPVVVLSKTDLRTDVDSLVSRVRTWVGDVDIVPVSVTNGSGIETILELLAGRTGTLIGESGAGKSSLVNAVMEDEVAWIGDVRDRDAKGRHTTTHRELHLLPGGGMIIDNPGVRALGLWAEGEGVEQLFSDIEQVGTSCRFRDCAHREEPGCAVRAAIEAGDLDTHRWESYTRFIDEQEGASRRAVLKQRRSRS